MPTRKTYREPVCSILALDTPSASLATVGGKGLNLARLARAGFAVPPGFVIATHAYTAFVDANALTGFIRATLDPTSPGDPASLGAAAVAIRARFAAGEVNPGTAAAICAAYAALGSPPVAVRSSATAEDLPGTSFAGQHDTFLNVVGEAALLEALVRCWSSLWTARAIGYRARNGIPHEMASMAVVVQEMVQSEASGVLFTANPLTGRRDQVVIDATLGLGEALVSGQVEPDHYVVDAPSERILEKVLGSKAVTIRGQAGGGTIAVPTDAAARQALPDETIIDLARLGRRVADLFGLPQDVEWATADGRLQVLQSRPITTLYPLPEGMPAAPLRVMFSLGSIQGVLDPLTLFGRDVLRTLFAGAAELFGYHFTAETLPLSREAGERLWVDCTALVRSRIGRQLLLKAMSAVDPGATRALHSLVEGGRFPPPGNLRARTVLRLLRVLLPAVVRAVRTLLWPDAERERVLRQIEAMVTDAVARSALAVTLGDRVAFVRRTIRGAFYSILPRFVPRFGMGMATLNLLHRLAATLPEGKDVLAMTRGLPHNVTTEMDLALWHTAQAIRSDSDASAHCREVDAATLSDEYLAEGLPRRAQEALCAFLERYGMRGPAEIDVGRPRWREDVIPIVRALQSYLQITSPDLAPDAVFERGRAEAEAEIERLVTAIRHESGWFKAQMARWAAYRVRALLGLRESPKFGIVRLLGIVREMLLASGKELVEDGLLLRPDDVFYLRLAELDRLAAGQDHDWQPLVRDRRRAYAYEQRRRQIPLLLLSDGQAFYGGTSVQPGEEDAALAGSGVSPGVVEGRVRVVLDPRSAQLAPGEILVCPGTDPSWTPLFLAAGGLVMEVGGLMTHGSVVAREYGIPAVVGVHRVTERLATGQRVRLNGSAGRVVVLQGKGTGAETEEEPR